MGVSDGLGELVLIAIGLGEADERVRPVDPVDLGSVIQQTRHSLSQLAEEAGIEMSVLLPDTPVTQVNSPSGRSTSTSCRLLPRAPRTVSLRSRLNGVRASGTAISRLPARYWPVIESSTPAISSAVPWATTCPP